MKDVWIHKDSAFFHKGFWDALQKGFNFGFLPHKDLVFAAQGDQRLEFAEI